MHCSGRHSPLRLLMDQRSVRNLRCRSRLDPIEGVAGWCLIQEATPADRLIFVHSQLQVSTALLPRGGGLQSQLTPLGYQKPSRTKPQSPVLDRSLIRSPFSLASCLRNETPLPDKKLKPRVCSSHKANEGQPSHSKAARPHKQPLDTEAHRSDSQERPSLPAEPSPPALNRNNCSRRYCTHSNIIEVEEEGTTYQFLGRSSAYSPSKPLSLSDIEALNYCDSGNTPTAVSPANRNSCPARQDVCSIDAHCQSRPSEKMNTRLSILTDSSKQHYAEPPKPETPHRIRKITIIASSRRPPCLAAETASSPR